MASEPQTEDNPVVPAPEEPPEASAAAGPAEPSAPAPGGPLDLRLLPYVLVPLLVLAIQLFFTFSRDSLPADMLGAADMTK